MRAKTKLKLTPSESVINDCSKHSKTGEPKDKYVYTVADESGLSIVGVTEVEAGRKQRGRMSSGVGLFSDVESDV